MLRQGSGNPSRLFLRSSSLLFELENEDKVCLNAAALGVFLGLREGLLPRSYRLGKPVELGWEKKCPSERTDLGQDIKRNRNAL